MALLSGDLLAGIPKKWICVWPLAEDWRLETTINHLLKRIVQSSREGHRYWRDVHQFRGGDLVELNLF